MSTGPEFPQPDHGAPPPRPYPDNARANLTTAAIFSIVVSALSILGSAGSVVVDSMLHKFLAELASQDPNLQQPDMFGAFLMDPTNPIAITVKAAGALLSVLSLAGAIQMLRLRSYGLAMAGAIANIANLCGGCCCLLNMGAGIWALVLLLRPEAKEAFTTGTT